LTFIKPQKSQNVTFIKIMEPIAGNPSSQVAKPGFGLWTKNQKVLIFR